MNLFTQIDDELGRNFKLFALKKHNKLHGAIKIELEAAMREHLEKERAESNDVEEIPSSPDLTNLFTNIK